MKNKDFLEFFLDRWEVDIVILSEIFKIEYYDSKYRLRNFNLIFKTRDDNYGGVAIAARKYIKLSKISYNTTYDVVMAQTTNLRQNITFVSAYFPQSIKKKQFAKETRKMLNFLENKDNVILCGDFNARSTVFGDIIDSSRGKALAELITDSAFRCLNNGTCTFHKGVIPSPQDSSILDLAFTNSNIVEDFQVIKEKIGGSHHWPIVLNLKVVSKAITFVLKKKLAEGIKRWKPTENLDAFYKMLNRETRNASVTLSNTFYTPKKWWNKEIEVLYRKKKAALLKYNRSHSYRDAEAFLKLEDNWKQEIRKAKLDSFNEAILDAATNMKSLFAIAKGCNTGKPTKSKTGWDDESNKAFLMKLVPKNNADCSNSNSFNSSNIHIPFTLNEFYDTLDLKRKGTTPGYDGVRYDHLRALTIEGKTAILNTLNRAWCNNEIYDEWRKIKICPIPKKGKNNESILTHRPIALMSVMLKIINLMVKERLTKFLVEKKHYTD